MSVPTPLPRSRRIDLFDGVRGIALIVVVISHGWAVWPTDALNDHELTKRIFSSGDFAVSVFMVVGAFLATRGMLAAVASPAGLKPGTAAVRRWFRLSGQLYALLLTVLVVNALDTTDIYPKEMTRDSVLRAATYSFNWFLRESPGGARPDLGHLWYLSVDFQVFLFILVLVWALRRRPALIALSLGALLVACLIWRAHAYDVEGWYSTLLRTSTRADAPLTGAFAAALVPFAARARLIAPTLTGLSVVALLPLIWFTSPPRGYFGVAGVLLDVALGTFVLCATLATPPRLVAWMFGAAPLAFLGRHSLSVYLWHFPVFWYVSRHWSDLAWQTTTVIALSLTAALSVLSEVLVERRVQSFLTSTSKRTYRPQWRRPPPGWHAREPEKASAGADVSDVASGPGGSARG